MTVYTNFFTPPEKSKHMKSIPPINKINAKLVISLFLVAILSVVYTWTFIDLFENGESGGSGITGTLIPDTFLYRYFFENPDYRTLLGSGIKNSVAPALLWKLLNGNWYMASIFNVGMLFFSVVFLSKIANHIGIPISNKLLFFLVLLPETLIYTVGVLKEIPTLFLFSALSFYFLKNRWFPFFFCLILLALFRYQFFIVITLFLVGHLFFRKENIRFLVLVFLILSSLYPLLAQLETGLSVQEGILYREDKPGTGVGALIQSVQTEWYGLSTLATMVKIFQILVAPWPFPRFPEGSDVDVLTLVWSISSLVLFPVWFKYFRFLFYALRYPNSIKQDEGVLLSMSFVFGMMIGLSGFIQHRYLYPGLGLILLVAYIPIASRLKSIPPSSPKNLPNPANSRETNVVSGA